MIFTIGHSNHTMDFFLRLLIGHRVTGLADVRSAPYSRFNPHFNREQLAAACKDSGIMYAYLGRELGGRSDDQRCYENGRIRYDRVARTQLFSDGLRRILQGAKKYNVALMCAEKEPLHCHRTLLIGHELDKLGIEIAHIVPEGRPEPHSKAMERLLAEFDRKEGGALFRQDMPHSDLIEEAISYQTTRVGNSVKQVPMLSNKEVR
ncbi:MAG: DUF488 domain-containing protein [Albidovulum sp.]|nr:DUF488 domain-containing protein [Albidovulum sp.]